MWKLDSLIFALVLASSERARLVPMLPPFDLVVTMWMAGDRRSWGRA